MSIKIFLFWLLSVLCHLPFVTCSAQWSKNPFEQKVFIENNGQFDAAVRFRTTNEGMNVEFSQAGLVYSWNKPVINAEKGEEGEERKKERPVKMKHHELRMQWVGSNPAVQIISEGKVSFDYSYSFDPRKQEKGIRAAAYRKIIYKDLYPHIDVEYILPEKGGVKYSFIVHPGGDIAKIKMKWGDKISIDEKGNAIIHSSFGDFIDHAPETFYEDDRAVIPSSFKVENNYVSFVLQPQTLNSGLQTIIIDPWITNPNITGYNEAYDVDYDFARNVYVYGGDGWNNPFELVKLNSSGAIQWVFVTSVFSNSGWYNYYGDFAVDGYTQSIYIAEGMSTSPGARMIKLNPAGTQVAMHPGSVLEEIWRIVYNSCTKQGVIGGSGRTNPTEAALFDTTLGTINPVHMLGAQGLQDLDLLAIDNQNNCFMGFQNNGSSAGNQLLKCPANTLLPSNYLVGNDFEFAEVKSMQYVGGSSNSNGMNGIAVNSKDLYTYNGYKVKKHNKNTGAVVDSAIITPPQYAFFSSDLLIYWAGIAVDECDHIFVGSHDTIFQMDINLNKVGFMVAAGTVYDLKLSPQSDTLYATGENFVSALNSGVICNGLNISAAVAGSCSASSATVTATGGTAPYSYQWNPGGQTAQIATGLATGTYTVTVWDGSCPPIIKTATVNVTSGALTATITPTASTCLASNGSATATPTGGASPFTYSWSPSGGNGPVATGLSAGIYSVTITDASGCSGTSTVTIVTAGGPSVTVAGQSNVACFGGNNGSASLIASGGTAPYSYVWSNGNSTSASSNLTAGSYSILITDSNGCSQTQTVTITAPPAIVATATATPALCQANDGTASAAASGGTSPYTYSWSNGQSGASISNLASGTYSVTVTDANGCTQGAATLVSSTGGPTATISANVTIGTGSSATLTAGGGGTYVWSSGDSGSPIVVAPTVTTVYCVTVTDANNCIDTACTIVYVETEPGTTCDQFANADAFVLPSAFSPNWDSQNDFWRLLYPPELIACVTEFEVAVYNRWGERVFEGFTLDFAWDGKFNGKIEYTAVFGYYLNATLKNGTKIKKKGNISLLR